MIVLLLSLREVEDLLVGRSDKAMKDYLKRSLIPEQFPYTRVDTPGDAIALVPQPAFGDT